ncbi:MAG: hypothetical protein HWD61_05930 [Parachlamydiaceae bacterium]|nr:MAG: hypothetical protein HWD61_05930 [Parachlamydiaceae bacterium]
MVRKEEEEQRKLADKFHQAVVNAEVKECQELISKGFKPSIENFIVAVSSHRRDQNQFDLLELLMKQPGIGVNVRDRGGHLPLEYPIEKFNPEILEWLIKKGADTTQNRLDLPLF